MLPAKRRLRNSQPQFTPRQIFAAMQGAWLEPPTGVQLGPELVTNGNFSDGLNNWSTRTVGTGAPGYPTVSNGRGVVARNASATEQVQLYQSFATIVGRLYVLYFSSNIVSGTSGGTVFKADDSITGTNAVSSAASFTFTATSATTYVSLTCGGNNGVVSYDNISVREVLTTATSGIAWQENTGVTPVSAPAQTVGKLLDLSGGGNNATQATAANRPTYQLDANNLPLIRHDTTDYLTASLPNLGGGVFSASGSVYFATPQGMSCVHNKSMGTTYNLPALSTDVYAWCVTPARLNAVQEAQLERYFLRKAGIAVPDYLTDENGYILTDDNDNLLLAG